MTLCPLLTQSGHRRDWDSAAQRCPASVLSSGRRPGERPNRFRTIQVCPKDLPIPLRHLERAVDRPAAPKVRERPTSGMRRREFISLLGGVAAAWPLAARAQQLERMRRIGVLMTTAADDPEGQARIAAFLQGLQQWGWAVGGNVRIDIRYGADDAV